MAAGTMKEKLPDREQNDLDKVQDSTTRIEQLLIDIEKQRIRIEWLRLHIAAYCSMDTAHQKPYLGLGCNECDHI